MDVVEVVVVVDDVVNVFIVVGFVAAATVNFEGCYILLLAVFAGVVTVAAVSAVVAVIAYGADEVRNLAVMLKQLPATRHREAIISVAVVAHITSLVSVSIFFCCCGG